MTARKHEVKRKRQSARERLVEALWYATYADDGSAYRYHLRLLRAHEREMVQLAANEIAGDPAACSECRIRAIDAIRAAILSRPRRERSGR